MLVDRAKITIRSGRGGNGAVSFRREPFVPQGGPDGGDGGNGGNVIIKADEDLRTLMDFRYKRVYEAENGQNGMKKKMYGKKGQDLVIKVPVGTMVFDAATGLLMHDLNTNGDSFVAAKGGKGGKGNVHFKNSVRQAPNFAEAGTPGTERVVILELKLIADVGLVGFPNVGKSSILAAATNARPKIDNYHFTTIDPNLGVVVLDNTEFVLADIAGLIEGAHEGQGLGFRFLKHIERTKVLIHVVDVSGSEGRDPEDDFEKILKELGSYSEKLTKKPMIVAANKIDLLGDDLSAYEKFKSDIEAKGYRVFPVSAATGAGIKDLMNAAAGLLAEQEALPQEEEHYDFYDFDEENKDGDDYRTVNVTRAADGTFVLSGRQLQKIFDSTNFNDMGSLRYLYKYIEKSGAVEKMKEMGLEDGDTVKIDDFEFEYEEED